MLDFRVNRKYIYQVEWVNKSNKSNIPLIFQVFLYIGAIILLKSDKIITLFCKTMLYSVRNVGYDVIF